MLSQNKVVKKARKAIEITYIDTCTITNKEEYEKENSSTGFKDVIKCENAQCKLSYSSIPEASPGEVSTSAGQTIKLFIAPEIDIPAGSIITVTHYGVAGKYKRSGIPAVYVTHQEIILVREEQS